MFSTTFLDIRVEDDSNLGGGGDKKFGLLSLGTGVIMAVIWGYRESSARPLVISWVPAFQMLLLLA